MPICFLNAIKVCGGETFLATDFTRLFQFLILCNILKCSFTLNLKQFPTLHVKIRIRIYRQSFLLYNPLLPELFFRRFFRDIA